MWSTDCPRHYNWTCSVIATSLQRDPKCRIIVVGAAAPTAWPPTRPLISSCWESSCWCSISYRHLRRRFRWSHSQLEFDHACQGWMWTWTHTHTWIILYFKFNIHSVGVPGCRHLDTWQARVFNSKFNRHSTITTLCTTTCFTVNLLLQALIINQICHNLDF